MQSGRRPLPEYLLHFFFFCSYSLGYLSSVTLKESTAAVIFRLSWIYSSIDLGSLFWRVMIRIRQIACLCSMNCCTLLFLQLGSFFTLQVVNQLKRLNLRAAWLRCSRLGPCARTDGPLSILILQVQPTQLFSRGTPPQRINFSPILLVPMTTSHIKRI